VKKWWAYVQDVSGQASQTEIAKRLGMSQPGVNRWEEIVPKTESVIAFARAYNRPILEAFLAAEYVSDEDVLMTEVQADVSGMDTDALVQLIHRATDELSRRPPT